MSIALVASHCHLDRLDLAKLGGDLGAVLARAGDEGITRMLCVCIDLDNFPDVLRLAREYPQVYASVGVQPNERDTRDHSVDELVEHAREARVVAIGETGLDYHYGEGEGELEWQRECFRCHISVANAGGKPLIILSRAAQDDT